ncbi:acyl-CoA carboxylase subunit epsilon [Streptomyces sp. NPDC093094]|uniref:acyl-CoA carboxylase subunit epsilon n=1 Tax=Streptomyces sp. NPDC093094 TaxID=3366026 RepID=UPI003818EE69
MKVVRGNPTPEELAAALTVVTARAAAAQTAVPGAPAPRDSWSDPSRIAARRLPQPGEAAWARSCWPG